MKKDVQKTALIVLGSVGGAAALGAAAVALWNSRRMRAMRAVHRTNLILNRVGNALCRFSELAEG